MNASMVGYWLQGKEVGESFPGYFLIVCIVEWDAYKEWLRLAEMNRTILEKSEELRQFRQ